MKRITKTTVASVKITSDDSVILSLKTANDSANLYFESTDQFAEAVKKKQIHAKKRIISVPDSLCIIKTVELPAASIEQAHKMLEFEVSTYLPLSAEELVYGCIPLSQNENLFKFSVYILKIKALEDILARFKAVGFMPSRVMVDSVAIGSWFGRDGDYDAGQINILYRKDILLISAYKDGNRQRYEGIPLVKGDFESKKDYIINEINELVSEFYRDKHPILKVAVDSIQSEIKSWFQTNYNNVEFLELPVLNSFDKETSSEKDYALESVITDGLLKAVEEPHLSFLNLLPLKMLKKTQQKQLMKNSAITIGIGILAVFCLWLNFATMNWRIQRVCLQIAKEIAPIKNIAADVDSKRQKVEAIQVQLSNRDQISEIFSQLCKYSPPNISISHMSYSLKSDAASINITGQADMLSSAFEYSAVMKDSGLLNNIQIINAQQIPKPGGSIVEFKAECIINESSRTWQ